MGLSFRPDATSVSNEARHAIAIQAGDPLEGNKPRARANREVQVTRRKAPQQHNRSFDRVVSLIAPV